MIGYQTQQRNTLLAFFQAHPDQSFTVDEVTALLRARLGENAPSRSTVYRTVAGLEAEQALKRWQTSAKAPTSTAIRWPAPLTCTCGARRATPWSIWTRRFPPLWRSFCMSHQTYFWIWAIPRWWAAAKNAVTLFNTPKGGGIYAQSQAVGGRALRAVCRCPDGVQPVCCHACTASLHRGPLPRMRGTVCLHGTVAPGCCFCSSLVRCLRSPACCPLAAACDAF